MSVAGETGLTVDKIATEWQVLKDAGDQLRPLQFTIPGRVNGKGRPRATIRGGHAHVYTPAKTANMEQMIRGFAAAAMTGRNLMIGALELTVIVNLERPVSWSKRKRAENPVPTGRPDIDNIGKGISDAMNGIVYRDDSQISLLHIGRRFVDGGGESVEVSVRAMAPIGLVAA